MNRKKWLVAAAISLVGGAAQAAERPESWTLGAGGSFTSFGSLSVGDVSLGSSLGSVGLGGIGGFSPGSPSATAGLERRIGRGLWLTINVAGAGSTGTSTFVRGSDVPPVDGTISTFSFMVAPGLRQVITPDETPVEVSLFGEVQVAFARASVTPEGDSIAGQTAHAFRAGLTGGFAVERRLTEALSVRGAAHVVGLFYDRSTAQGLTFGTSKSEGVSFTVGIVPSLELRFAF